jgi:biotin transport system ATP-binding protein
VIELQNVSLRRGDADILREISWNTRSRTVAVIGENGSGKSSLARVVAGLDPPSGGAVRVLDIDVVRDRRELRRRVAVVFSNPDAQIVMPTVAEDVAFSLRGARLSRDESTRRVDAALERFGLTRLAGQSAHDLSGGEKQLLALCGAFIRDPHLLIADEPTAYLDARHSRLVASHLFGGSSRLLLVTHDLELARRCETGILVRDGRIARSGPVDDVIAEYQAGLQ